MPRWLAATTQYGFLDQEYPGQVFNHVESLFEPDDFRTTSGTFGYNTGTTSWLATVSNQQEMGLVRANDGYQRYDMRLNLDHRLRNDLSLSMSVFHMRSLRGWDACVAALGPGSRLVPHVILVRPGRSGALLDLLKALGASHRAVHAVVDVDPALGERLTEILAPLAACAIRRGPVAVIAALLAGGDPYLAEFVEVALEAPARRTTVGGVLRAVKAPTKAVRRAMVRCGLAPPSGFLRAVRVLGAHALLVDGATVEEAARAMGYSSPDILRDHFRRTVGVAPSEARTLSTDELAGRLDRAG